VELARLHPAELVPAGHRNRLRPVEVRPITVLAEEIVTPAVGLIISRHAARVFAAQAEVEESKAADDRDGSQAVSGGGERAVPELAVKIEPQQ
jgi:hypothetical protein